MTFIPFRFIRCLSIALLLAAPLAIPPSTTIVDGHARAPATIESLASVHVGEHVGLVGAALGI